MIAADRMYFPESKDAAGIFHLVHVWKTISSSNARFHCNDRLGNATELKFLKARASRQHQNISNCGKFTLSLQSNAALVRIPYDVTRIYLTSFWMNNISMFWQWDCRVIQWGGGWASIARWVMGSFQYLPRATSKNIENHEPGERMIWHQ